MKYNTIKGKGWRSIESKLFEFNDKNLFSVKNSQLSASVNKDSSWLYNNLYIHWRNINEPDKTTQAIKLKNVEQISTMQLQFR